MLDNYYDAQRAIIGCLIIDPQKCADEIFEKVKPHHFCDPDYKALFEKAYELHNDGIIDQLVMQHKTPEYRKLIMEIVDATPTAQNYREYIAVIHDEFKLYRADELKEKLPELIRGGDVSSVHDALTEVQQLFEQTTVARSPAGVGELFMDFADGIDRHAEYIRFGFKGLDGKLFVEKGDYVVIGARPSVGKTAIALNIAHEISKKHKTIFFSFETSKEKLAARYFANVLNTDFGKIKNRTLSDEEKGNLLPAFAGVASNMIYFEEASGWTANEVCASALREKAEVIFVDYLGLVSGEGKSDYERVSAISKYFHIFAQKHKVLVVLLSQLNREGASKDKPDLVNLRDSGQIEQDADVIMLLHKPKEDDSMRELIVAKNKEGEVGSVPLDFDGSHQRFFESKRSSDIFKEIKQASRKAKQSAADRVFGPAMTEITDEKELATAQAVLPM